VIFASKEPVAREVLARRDGPQCNLDLVIEDIRAELRGRPYDLIAVAGGWHLRTRKQFADAAIHLAMGDRRCSRCRAPRTWCSPRLGIFSRSPAASSRSSSARR
jgi:chromosome segregation and condensation protein ScpB